MLSLFSTPIYSLIYLKKIKSFSILFKIKVFLSLLDTLVSMNTLIFCPSMFLNVFLEKEAICKLNSLEAIFFEL